MEIKESFKQYIEQFAILSNEEFSELYKIMKIQNIKRRDHFVKVNEYCLKLLFTNNGYFRFYHTDDKGNEITSDFYFAPTFITAYSSFILESPSITNVQAMEDMEILEFEKRDLYRLYSKYPNIAKLGRKITEDVSVNFDLHISLLLNSSARKRYQKLIQNHPHYIENIPLQYIASYLGIKKESLSRIRKALA